MKRTTFIILSALLLAACGPAAGPAVSGAPQAWFDMPLPGTVIFPPNPCQVVAHGASANGVATFELSVNGYVATSAPNPVTGETLATWSHACPPLQAGWNLLEFRVQDQAGTWSDYSETTVFLAGETGESTGSESPPPSSGATPTTRPVSVTASATPTLRPGSVAIVSVSTNLVFLGRSDCGPMDVTITAQASAPQGIETVWLYFRFQTGNSSSDFEIAAMSSSGGGLYQYTLNPSDHFGGSVPFEHATLEYKAVVQQADGSTTLQTAVHSDIAVEACGGGASSCSVYTDERACIENGCNWVYNPDANPPYACQAP
ncbi:MAG: hypothetical protein FJZ96_01800 [Chloroflexi bacterium]|nr:hypothetical protein [Chloroflexota bacterium]